MQRSYMHSILVLYTRNYVDSKVLFMIVEYKKICGPLLCAVMSPCFIYCSVFL